MIIIIPIILGIIIFYKMVIPYIHNQYHPTTEQRITKGLLSMSFWQILVCSLVCAYALEVKPSYNEYKQTDVDVSSFLQENSELGDLIHEYTGINGYSNLDYLISEAQSLHTYAIIFIVISVIIALAMAIGSIGKKLDRRIIEGLAILNTLACCWICKSSTDICEAIVRDGVTMQTIAWIGRLLGTDIYAAMDMMIRIVWILPIILIVKHFFYHKTLNECYADAATGNINNEESLSSCQSRQVIGYENATDTVSDSVPAANDNMVVQEKEESSQQSISVEEAKEPIQQTVENKKEQPKPIVTNNENSSSSRFWFVLCGIVIAGFIIFLYWQYNNDDSPTKFNQGNALSVQDEEKPVNYKERSEAIISQLTERYGDGISILYKYPELSKYCAFSLVENETEYLLIYDLEQEVLKRFENNCNLRTTNAGEICLPYYTLSMNEDNDKILIQGNNGANSTGYTEYILELNPLNWTIMEICSGREIIKQENGYKANRIIMTKWGTCVADSEYANIDIYYDFNGKLIPSPLKGESYQFKGKIDNRYAVTMQLSIWNDKIYGEYYYDRNGSENVLYLYGGISSGRDIVLLEFNDKGEQTGTFKGKFGRESFSGTFVNYQNKEMPFELFSGNGSSSNTTLKWYYNSRFDYRILYPSSFNIIKEPENGDGCRFSKDDNTYLSVSGMYNSLDETLEDVYKRYKSKSPAYCRIKDNWFVVSDNTDDGYIFYQKTVLKDGIFMTAILHYPSSENDYYSTLIPKIFTDFPD